MLQECTANQPMRLDCWCSFTVLVCMADPWPCTFCSTDSLLLPCYTACPCVCHCRGLGFPDTFWQDFCQRLVASKAAAAILWANSWLNYGKQRLETRHGKGELEFQCTGASQLEKEHRKVIWEVCQLWSAQRWQWIPIFSTGKLVCTIY